MTFEIPGQRPATPQSTILVVDDDRRVLELLEVALCATGYRVITAQDGDEAIRRAIAERPDLIVLDVRLPKKSGLEVCDHLRHDPDDPFVPIVLVSAAVEPEMRLQAFRRGADDYLSKPFSPKELIARVRRLLTRSAEATEARRRARELDLEVGRVRDELRRAHADLARETRRRELTTGLGRDLHRALDVDEVARRLLLSVQSRIGIGMAALLTPGDDGAFELVAIRGDDIERGAALELPANSEVVALVSALGRPVARRELERLPELRAEVAPLVAAGIGFIAPLEGPDGLEALLVGDERRDGADLSPGDVELLGGLCEVAAVALRNANRFRAQVDGVIALLAGRALRVADANARAQIAELVMRAARAALLPSRHRGLLRHALALGEWGRTQAGGQALARVAANDPSGRASELARLLGHGAPEDAGPEERRAGLLLAVAQRALATRGRRRRASEALAGAIEDGDPSMDAATAQALADAMAEARHARTTTAKRSHARSATPVVNA